MNNKSSVFLISVLALLGLIAIFLIKSQISGTKPEEIKTSADLTVSPEPSTPVSKPVNLEKPRYVGREQCVSCHAEQYQAWQGSHHDLAMQDANEQTVLGNFNNTKFTYYGVVSTFFKKDGKYFVNTDNAKGEMQDFEIKYTFGVTPLQQYLIEFPGGRLQALNIVWDTHTKAQGGQRWVHLYPKENIDHKDPLHWTGVYQNWNNMCAECHSTELKKNYSYEKDVYDTQWSEINVSCEACHGPASSHVQWAQAIAKGESWPAIKNKGLLLSLSDPKRGQWVLKENQKTASRAEAFDTSIQLQTCARCHSRRGVFSDDYRHGRPLMDTHNPSLLDEELYYADGQIKDEVYVYASFLQSKMHQAGVICSDCHNPHSLELKQPGNAVCTQCHNKEIFDVQNHHHHQEKGAGAQCVECHMPATTYMVVDPRRDHSMRIPRPDLSEELKSPNACIMCHKTQTNRWAEQAITKWTGKEKSKTKHYGQVFQAGRSGQAQIDIELADIALDKKQPAIVRATAVNLLRNYAYPRLPELLDAVYLDDDPLIRAEVANLLEVVEPRMRLKYAVRLLKDPVRLVRMSAARVLVEVPENLFQPAEYQAYQSALNEYVDAQQYNTDRPEGRINLGTLYISLNQPDKAELYLKSALDIGAALAQPYVNLADLYRVQQRDKEGEAILRLGIKQSENPAPIHHALGLLLVRNKRVDDALKELEKATQLAPDEPRYSYVYGVALQSVKGHSAAIDYLKKVQKYHPSDLNILFALASFNLENGDLKAAAEYANQILILAPQHQGAQQILDALDRR
ncbi:tetratricopeptide repeat protein [Kaarinaea lacus]